MIFSETGISLFSEDYLTRLQNWEKHGSWGPEDEGSGVVAVTGKELVTLQGHGNEVSEPACRHRVLTREEPVVGLHPQLVAPRHGFGEESTAHATCGHRCHRNKFIGK